MDPMVLNYSRTGISEGPLMADGNIVQIAPLMREPGMVEIKMPPKLAPNSNGAMICGVDVGSTTVKYVLASPSGEVISQAYERHNTKQGEKVLQFLARLEAQHDFTPQRDRIFLTGSGAGLIAPIVGAKVVQEVVAVAASVERLHPDVRFVSEIGGEDMKTIFFNGNGTTKSKQVLMQSACSGGTGTFIEKTARKLQIAPEALSEMRYTGHTLHKISSKCGIFAEADANTLLKAGVTVDEIIASLFEAVVYQNLATLTRGNTPSPEVLLLGGPNLFFKGLQEAWRLHLTHIWQERKIQMPNGKDPEEYIVVPKDALYYAALGCIEVALGEQHNVGIYLGTKKLQWWIEEGQYEDKKKQGRGGLCDSADNLKTFIDVYSKMDATSAANIEAKAAAAPPVNVMVEKRKLDRVLVGCDFGSTTAKAVCLGLDKELLFSCYALSKGNPIEDAKILFRQLREAIGDGEILGLGITGYGKDLLKGILGADCGVVETIAHASAGLHYFPDADCICDVGGVDVKIMILKNGTVSDFRLNSQCSSGNGAFLQGVAERFGIPLSEMADKAFLAQAMPQLSMGCGVFLQSDIVNQQRKGWQAEEILAALCSILPLNVWIYAGGMNNLSQVGKKYILQGGTHKNLAVVKTQVDFIRSKVPDADVVVHPYSGEAGAIGAALVSLDWWEKGGRSTFRGFDVIEKLTYNTTTAKETICNWCPVTCQRSFIDVALPGGQGREWSKVPISLGWERVIVNNSCPKGLVEDLNEMKVIKAGIEKTKNAFPNIADMVRQEGFCRNATSA
jgi:predicted CoA-substrate-specific enzyme activase